MVLIAIGLGWVLGLVPVAAWGAPSWMGAAWVVASLPALLLVGPLKGRHALGGAVVVAAMVSGWRLDGASTSGDPSWVEAIGEDVRLTGIVESEPNRSEITTSYTLRVESLTTGNAVEHSGGKVIAYLNQYDEYLPGDVLTVVGELELPPQFDGFDYRAFLARDGISATIFRPSVETVRRGEPSLTRWLTQRRLALDRSLQRSLPEPASSLAAGIAFGRDDGLSNADKDEFNKSGLRHLVAVSGSNVTIVAAFVYLLTVPAIGRRWAWIPAALAIAAYLGAAGFAPSVLRAGLMAGTFLVGSAIGRPQGGLPALFIAIIGLTVVSPGLATDPGFLLSAAATAGIIAFYARFDVWLRWLTSRSRYTPVPVWGCQAAAITLAATVSTLPIMWVTFERVSLISPVANVLVEPFFVLAFLGSILTAALGLASETAGVAVGTTAFYPLAFISWAAATLASMPSASVGLPQGSATAALVVSGALGILALASYRYPTANDEEPAQVRARRTAANRFLLSAAAGVTAVAVVPVSLLPRGSNSDVTVRFFDVGQGDSALITTPHGKQIVIDGGPSGIRMARNLGAALPHWDRSVDAVILTHPQEDHMAGLVELSARYSVGVVYDNGRSNGTRTFGYFEDELPKRETLTTGDEFVMDGVTFQVLWPRGEFATSNLNDTSLVVRVTFGGVSILFTGDAEGPALAEISAELLDSDVLKVPHHGSKTTPSSVFEAVSPGVAVISVGERNIFGHPHPDTLNALAGYPVFRTDEHGTVTIRSDGTRIRVSTAR